MPCLAAPTARATGISLCFLLRQLFSRTVSCVQALHRANVSRSLKVKDGSKLLLRRRRAFCWETGTRCRSCPLLAAGCCRLGRGRRTPCPRSGFSGGGRRLSRSSRAGAAPHALFYWTNLDCSAFVFFSQVLLGMPSHGFVWDSLLIMWSVY